MAIALSDGEEGQIVCLRQRGAIPLLAPEMRHFKKRGLSTYAEDTVLFSQFSDHFCILAANLSREAIPRRLAMLPVTSAQGGTEGGRE
jgi:hypothetical protein